MFLQKYKEDRTTFSRFVKITDKLVCLMQSCCSCNSKVVLILLDVTMIVVIEKYRDEVILAVILKYYIEPPAVHRLVVGMPKFQELEDHWSSQDPPPGNNGLVAKRYRVLRSLGRGSFGSVYLVQDTKSTDGEEL